MLTHRYSQRHHLKRPTLLSSAIALAAVSFGAATHQGRVEATEVVPANSASTQAAITQPAATQPLTYDSAFHVDLKPTLEYLASDALEGRGVGSDGLNQAGEFIASTFDRLGLPPLPGQPDHFQNFSMVTAVKPDPKTTLSSQDGTAYELGTQFQVASFSGQAAFGAPVVFVGYGISSKEHGYDDYAGIDVKDKVVLAMRFEPHTADGTSRFTKEEWSPEATLASKASTAASHGALALVLVNPPTYHPGDALVPFARQFPGERAKIPVLQVRIPIASAWLKAAGAADLKTLQHQIDSDEKPASTELKGIRVSGNVSIARTEKPVRNVLAILPGKGPTANEVVLIGAHYDHLGHGGPGSLAPGSHAIFNGADDNASGTTAMLALADYFAHQGPQPRTLVFAAWTAEEEGLIGSAYFVSHPPIPLDHIVANLNLDMVGRVSKDLLFIGGEGTAAAFDGLLIKSDLGSPLTLKSIGRGGFGPSDHMSFALKKIPVLFLFSGVHSDYHRPTDKASKINYAGMQDVVELAEKLVVGMDSMPRQTYLTAADANSMTHALSSGGDTGGGGASLGVVPDYSESENPTTKGVRISGTVPGSPAATAGLKEGDLIVQFEKDKVDTLYDLSDELGKHKPGDEITLSVIRDKQRIELHARLAARKSQ